MDLLVFPNQLFKEHPGFKLKPDRVILIEDSLFFGDPRYPQKFHLQKLWFHRSSMKSYEEYLVQRGYEVLYLEQKKKSVPLATHLKKLTGSALKRWVTLEPVDFILEKRLWQIAEKSKAKLEFLDHPGFLNSRSKNQAYRQGRSRWFMADFYKFQRRELNVLMDGDKPHGGQWSFDEENRKKVPKSKLVEIPKLPTSTGNAIQKEAKIHVEKLFGDHPGSLDALIYPTDHKAADKWLNDFLRQRFELFGVYEDAIVKGENTLWHSVLTPMLNAGLLTPKQILKKSVDFAAKNNVPLNSVEGFVRQIIGWREFMRATYDDLGVSMRNSNVWEHHRPLSEKFYDGTTGILPVDDCIRRVLETGYCHHIERLMVLGGFMFVCEILPEDIYRWFMDMFVDSYDWVMVPNVYGMSQNSDGGSITTKPYFSGSSYVRKMSNYSKGPWCDVWDGLYWRWIWKNRERLVKNHRWSMPCRMVEKMDESKRNRHLENAGEFLSQL